MLISLFIRILVKLQSYSVKLHTHIWKHLGGYSNTFGHRGCFPETALFSRFWTLHYKLMKVGQTKSQIKTYLLVLAFWVLFPFLPASFLAPLLLLLTMFAFLLLSFACKTLCDCWLLTVKQSKTEWWCARGNPACCARARAGLKKVGSASGYEASWGCYKHIVSIVEHRSYDDPRGPRVPTNIPTSVIPTNILQCEPTVRSETPSFLYTWHTITNLVFTLYTLFTYDYMISVVRHFMTILCVNGPLKANHSFFVVQSSSCWGVWIDMSRLMPIFEWGSFLSF